jgi:inosine-uridine nucleoside N-ribohydrolase
MCGNFSSLRNVNASKTEWNAALDPEAAERVFGTHVPGGHYIVGLETTFGFHMPSSMLTRLPKSRALQVVLQLHQTRHCLEKSLTMYDLVAAILALNPDAAKKERGNAASRHGLGSGSYSWQGDHEAGRHFRFTSISLRKMMREFLATFNDEVFACKSE